MRLDLYCEIWMVDKHNLLVELCSLEQLTYCLCFYDSRLVSIANLLSSHRLTYALVELWPNSIWVLNIIFIRPGTHCITGPDRVSMEWVGFLSLALVAVKASTFQISFIISFSTIVIVVLMYSSLILCRDQCDWNSVWAVVSEDQQQGAAES